MASSEQENISATPEELAFVEEFALAMERLGLVRMTGRTIGWLLVCDPPEQTFGQIADVLQASKGSISTALKFLTTAGWVTKSSKPGDRKDYYTVRPGAMADLVKAQSGQYAGFADVLAKGLDSFGDLPPEKTERVREMHELFSWLAEEIPAMMERWDREHGK
ncbi:GbsR/MarR family transcriptional regulator [Glycomyces buryatensis]|uniref:MarR family transcriptional regulator n=1 Tax=Glycomyces buryatensis TaxID=2570927 RepID=A0A4S8PX99_9ACTN|nr:MarR family transcriptional regulator [Glycomyces buryatensis]THV32859.1 MarR family transcriptional regulator [Glycomyces buryatensis]